MLPHLIEIDGVSIMEYLKKNYFPIFIICAACIGFALWLSDTVSAQPVAVLQDTPETVVVIDAGHGGEDGGAVSCTGVNESQINLEIALRVDDFCHLLGYPTVMLRTDDISLHDSSANTISEKKVSDLKNRVKLVNQVNNGILVSIHQNQFSESKYHGAQVFYAATNGSQPLAEQLQDNLRAVIDPANNRQCKPADSVYLLSKIQCPAVLVECGFLSNAQEEALLRDAQYQKKLAAVISCSICSYIQEELGENEI